MRYIRNGIAGEETEGVVVGKPGCLVAEIFPLLLEKGIVGHYRPDLSAIVAGDEVWWPDWVNIYNPVLRQGIVESITEHQCATVILADGQTKQVLVSDLSLMGEFQDFYDSLKGRNGATS